MKNYDFWKDFAKTGKIDDYLNYIACTREEDPDTSEAMTKVREQSRVVFKEGGLIAGINYGDGNGSVGHAGWRL